jgi:hypothetical protein
MIENFNKMINTEKFNKNNRNIIRNFEFILQIYKFSLKFN